MNFWDRIKKDLQKGVDDGLAFVKEGASVVVRKAEALTEEGKRRYLLLELKAKVKIELAELGGKVYDLSGKGKNPLLDGKIKAMVGRIKRLETQISKLEEIPSTTAKVEKQARGKVKKVSSRKPSTAKSTVKRSRKATE